MIRRELVDGRRELRMFLLHIREHRGVLGGVMPVQRGVVVLPFVAQRLGPGRDVGGCESTRETTQIAAQAVMRGQEWGRHRGGAVIVEEFRWSGHDGTKHVSGMSPRHGK